MPLKPCSSYETALKAPLHHGSVIFGMVLFALSLLCLPSLTSEWRASDIDHFEQEVDLENNSKGYHYATVRTAVHRPRDRCVCLWLHDVPD